MLALPPVLERLPGRVPAEPSPVEVAGTSALVVAAAVLTVALVRRARPGAARGRLAHGLHAWLHLEQAVHVVLVRPCLRLAAAAARADDRLLARSVAGVAGTVLWLARAAGSADAVTDHAVHGVAGALARGGRMVRRTSASGQLHHYYLQQVALLLVVLVVVSLVVLFGSSR